MACSGCAQPSEASTSLVAYVTPSDELVTQTRHRGHIVAVASMSDREYGAESSGSADWSRTRWAGWRSGPENRPIPVAALSEWLDGSVNRILAETPGSLLEIGCGSGLLGRRLLPALRSYVGIDVSERGLEMFRAALKETGHCPVSLHRLPAHEATRAANDDTDTVVMNSVVQYFPDEHYLREVLLDVAGLFRGDGVIHLGDVRDIRGVAGRTGSVEQELLIHPAWFFGRLPERWSVLCRPRAGAGETEMGRYRFDVTIFCSGPPGRARPGRPAADGWAYGRDVPNRRLAGERAPADPGPAPTEPGPMEPDDVGRLAQPGSTALAVTSLTDHRVFDVVHAPARAGTRDIGAYYQSSNAGRARRERESAPRLTTDPLAVDLERELKVAVRTGAARALPPHLRPAAVVPLAALPLTRHGKVDEKSLPNRATPTGPAVSGRTPGERILAAAWEDVLGAGPPSYSTRLRDVGATSLQLVELVDVVEREGGDLTLQELDQDLPFDQLAHLLATSGERSGPLFVTLRGSAGEDGGEDEPLVFLHALDGSLASYSRLIEYLPSRLTCHGIVAERHAGAVTLPRLAEEYRKVLEEKLPTKSVHLVGWSLGGAIAYEIAAQWWRTGRTSRVTLLDAPAPLAADPDREQRWHRLRQAGGPLRLTAGSKREANARALVDAFGTYRPQPSGLSVNVLVAAGRGCDESNDRLFGQGDSLGWEQYALAFALPVPGSHFSLLRDPHVADVAGRLAELAGPGILGRMTSPLAGP